MKRKRHKTHLRRWSAAGDFGHGHPSRNGLPWRFANASHDAHVLARRSGRKARVAFRRMASVAKSLGAMPAPERRRRALAFARCLPRAERDAALRLLGMGGPAPGGAT